MFQRIVTYWWVPVYGLVYSYLKWRSFRNTLYSREVEEALILSVCVHVATPFAILAAAYVNL